MVVQRLVFGAKQLANKCLLKNIRNVNAQMTQMISCRLIHVSRHLWAERHYSEKHEWVSVDGNIATIGISHYAQESLGDVVYAQLPDVGTNLKKDDDCGALESVKAASEVYSPISGKVTEKNKNVEDTPSLINSSCYENGWLYKMEFSDSNEVKSLMNEEQYKEFLKKDH